MSNCIARQPIFNKRMGIYGYELLHRSDEAATDFSNIDGNKASSETIVNSFHQMGIDKVTGGKRAFINFTEKLLLDGVATILPSRILVIELLEQIEPTTEVIQACNSLRKKGYTIALDDFILESKYLPLVEVADIIKLDFISTPMRDINQFAYSMRNSHTLLLAEKLETQESYEQAIEMGFKLFQGYFFSKPITLKKDKSLASLKIIAMHLMKLIFEPTINFHKIAEILKQDVALSYQLLKVVNSAFFGLRYTVSNIRQALAILGMDEVKKWIILVSMAELQSDKPDELIRMSLSRARSLELMAPYVGHTKESDTFYMVGLLSMIDVLVDMPMEDVIAETHIAAEIAQSITTKKGVAGELLQMVLHYEKGEWDEALEISNRYEISQETLTDIYLQSLEWSNNFH